MHQLALIEACKFIEEKLATHVEEIREVVLVCHAKNCLGSNLVNVDCDFIAMLVSLIVMMCTLDYLLVKGFLCL